MASGKAGKSIQVKRR